MKNADRGTHLKDKDENAETEFKGGDELAQERKKSDARQDAKKLQENREEMGVTENHKTADMEKEHRGTFP